MSDARIRALARFAMRLAQPSLRAAVAKPAPVAADAPTPQRMRAV